MTEAGGHGAHEDLVGTGSIDLDLRDLQHGGYIGEHGGAHGGFLPWHDWSDG
jgi:hypothetical protein